MTKPKSGRFHWIKWWPSRWFADRGLRACSLAARGAWHELLLTMHEENTGGYLLIGGEVPSAEDIARILGCSEKEWRACEAELERRKVFSRRESDGAIFCRSRVREAEPAGAPQGSPEGDPKGAPPDTPRVTEGSPPSRALLSSRPLSSLSEGGGAGGGSAWTGLEEDPPAGPSLMDVHLRMHPFLDTPDVRRALSDLERHREHRGKGAYSPQSWERLLTKWEHQCVERGGPPRFVKAIEAALETGACTPFDARAETNGTPTPAAEVPASSGYREMARTKRGG